MMIKPREVFLKEVPEDSRYSPVAREAGEPETE